MHRSDICQCRVDPHMIQDINEPRTPLDRHHRRSHMLALDLDQDGRGKACGTENNPVAIGQFDGLECLDRQGLVERPAVTVADERHLDGASRLRHHRKQVFSSPLERRQFDLGLTGNVTVQLDYWTTFLDQDGIPFAQRDARDTAI